MTTNGFYVTTFCNFAHRLSNGRPIGHECYILNPKALRAERDGVYQANIVKEPRQIVKGRPLKETPAQEPPFPKFDDAALQVRKQFNALFARMSIECVRWNLHHIPGTPQFTLLREDAVMDVPLPIVIHDVHCYTVDRLLNKLATIWPTLVVRS